MTLLAILLEVKLKETLPAVQVDFCFLQLSQDSDNRPSSSACDGDKERGSWREVRGKKREDTGVYPRRLNSSSSG